MGCMIRRMADLAKTYPCSAGNGVLGYKDSYIGVCWGHEDDYEDPFPSSLSRVAHS